jgi:hypothetical protein
MKIPSGKAAVLGTIVHQVFEWMARLKKAGKTHIGCDWLFERAWEENKHIELRKFTSRGISADFKKCKESIMKVIEDKYYNPYNMNILDIEKWFELDMEGEEWFTIDNKPFKIRGFIDVINIIDDNTIEIVDWKNGQQKDLSNMEEINFDNISKKIQPRIYHLAASILYPQYKNTIITFYYINGDGPITISLSEEDLVNTFTSLYTFFTTVKKDNIIKRNRSWRCRMCAYNKNDICTSIWSDLNTFGDQFVKDKYGNKNV